MKLKDRIAIITGAASGIGKAVAERFVEEGARVVVVDRSDEGENVAKYLGNGSIFIKADVSSPDEVKRFIDSTYSEFKRIDILMNNAAIARFNVIEDIPVEEWDEVIRTNLSSIFYGIKFVAPIMKSQKSGVVINTGSDLSFVADPGWASYTSAKHAILGLTKSAGIELIKYGIRVNALCPGPTNTPFITKGLSQEELDRISSHSPAGRLAEPHECAGAAVFLASDDSSYMNGTHILVDGGIIAKE